MTTKRRIWGLPFEEIFDVVDGKYIWIAEIKERFFYQGNWVIGLNEKFLKEARDKNVILRVKIGENTEVPVGVLSEKELRKKVKKNEYQDIPSMFPCGKPMRIFYMKV